MRRYGTEAVFLAKTAGEASSLLAQLSMGILNFKMEKDRQKSYDQTRLEDEARAEITQAHERQRMHTATDHLLHTQAPLLISPRCRAGRCVRGGSPCNARRPRFAKFRDQNSRKPNRAELKPVSE